MTVRKRTWTNRDGSQGEAWVVAYTDQAGKRRLKSFDKKREATPTRSGSAVNCAPASMCRIARASRSPRLAACGSRAAKPPGSSGRPWAVSAASRLAHRPADRRGETVEADRADGPRLRGQAQARSLARHDAQGSRFAQRHPGRCEGARPGRPERGAELRARRRRGAEAHADKRQKGKLKIGVDIPTPDEIKAILAAPLGRWRPLLVTAIFSGLRASELRGLRWADIDLKRGELHVRQRADCYNGIGRPKSEAGERIVPLPPPVVAMLREHRLACPKGPLDLVFPNGSGNAESHRTSCSEGCGRR